MAWRRPGLVSAADYEAWSLPGLCDGKGATHITAPWQARYDRLLNTGAPASARANVGHGASLPAQPEPELEPEPSASSRVTPAKQLRARGAVGAGTSGDPGAPRSRLVPPCPGACLSPHAAATQDGCWLAVPCVTWRARAPRPALRQPTRAP